MKNRRRVVVDASVARAAGDVTTHPTSTQCRETLLAVDGLSAVFCENLQKEWGKHGSRFAKLWFLKMVQERRVHYVVPYKKVAEIRAFIEELQVTNAERVAMLKDAHLLSAALASDKIVIALDERVRRYFSGMAASYNPIRSIQWSNPTHSGDGTIKWLLAGAKRETSRSLSAVK